ncbi:MAG: hypothetical protein CMP23_03800 [Rickettsiales bacterium]|nr:hypothetical protein [Rickettsiales bacterium]|tara:strand:+ start:716 stop:1666 length:951 start_codon:yes stop_codon:yes gene_type:complete
MQGREGDNEMNSASESNTACGGRRILVVDDDRDALVILGDFLEAKDMAVVTAMDGHEALARFHDDGPFDLAVLDVMMPGLDGLEVCRRLKASPQGQLTPVLLVSARTDTKSRVAGLYGGADDYINKPVDLTEFLARVEVLLRVRDRYQQLNNRRSDAIDAALVDGLTGTVNALYFKRRLTEEIQRADRYQLAMTVILIDVLGLPDPPTADRQASDTNPTAGSSQPVDKLLAKLGLGLSSTLRGHDLIARLRRSRFAVLLSHTSKQDAQAVIERVKAAASQLKASADQTESLSLRIGCAELGPKMNSEGLLARAEPL